MQVEQKSKINDLTAVKTTHNVPSSVPENVVNVSLPKDESLELSFKMGDDYRECGIFRNAQESHAIEFPSKVAEDIKSVLGITKEIRADDVICYCSRRSQTSLCGLNQDD